MAGNSIGQLFRVTTCGESHGVGLMAIVDGVPPGLELTADDLQKDLDRRKPGTSKFATQRKEPDEVEIISGVFEGKTTGTSIGLLIRNTDQKSKDYGNIAQSFRPGHAATVITETVLLCISIVCMTRAESLRDIAIVFRFLVSIAD